MPVRKSAENSPEMQEFFKQHPNFKTAIDQLPKTRAQDSARVFVPNGDDIISKALDRITTNQEEVATVFKQLSDDLTREAQPVIRQVKALNG
jgi:sn-glycerol 3-phosphate transport system substrate-binding protein